MASANDAPDRKNREIRNLRDENQRLRGRVDLLAQLSRKVSASLDLATVLQAVVDAACDLTGARYGALGVFQPSGRIEQFITHGVTQEERARIGPPPEGLGLLGWLQHVQEPLRLSDLSQHPRSVGFPANHPPMKSFLGAPIRLGSESYGNLYLTEKAGAAEFSAEDEGLLMLFAAQAAMAMHNARLHQRVEAERRQLQTLVDISPVGVIVLEAGTRRVILANREIERLLGSPHPAGGVLNQSDMAATYRRSDGRPIDPEDLPLERAMVRGETVRAEETRFVLPDGRSIPVLVNATPVRADDGTIVAGVAIIQDTTPLEELDKLRNEFLGMVSHELKTPLTAIKGSAATVLGSKRPLDADETRELFEIIDEQADRLRDLVDNLLDITRIEAGRLSVNLEPTDLGSILDEVKTTFARVTGDRSLQVILPDQLPTVKGDRRRIIQVFLNLLSNAAKFSPEGQPIEVTVEQESPTHIRVQVRDQGRGIPPEKLPYLFKKFSQAHDDSKSKTPGTGLGLAICKGIIEAHGGRIWAESDGEGKGSAFIFTLQTSPEAAPQTPIDTARRAAHVGKVHRAGERTRVLAVDDEPQVLRYLQRTLSDGGYHAIGTAEPGQVITLIEQEEPDLVVLDVLLPGVTGFDLLARIREFSGVPVIFLTANTASEDMVKALKMGADDYVAKPFSPSELLARIEAVLRRRVLSDTVEVRPLFAIEDLSVNFAERRVTRGGQPIALSATEYKLLYELAIHAGMVLTHEQILQRVWGEEYSGETELVRSVVRNLRKKLGDDARNPRFIFTESQVGYRMPRPAQTS